MCTRWSAVVTAVAAACTIACTDARPQPPDPIGEVTGKDIVGLRLRRAEDRGHELFAAYCATCHGEDAGGQGQNASRLEPRPPDLRTAFAERGAEYTRQVIELGTAAVGRSPLCPPRGRQLSGDQVDSLVMYVARLAREQSRR